MRIITLHSLLSLPFFLLASCVKDGITDNAPDMTGNEGDIVFDIGFAPASRVSTDVDFKSAWENGDEIGIFAVTHGENLSRNASENYINNVKVIYTNASDGGSWTVSEILFWPDGDQKLDFYAYYPYDDSATDPTAIAFKVFPDQSGRTAEKNNYNLSDLMTAKSDNNASGWEKKSTVTLSFSHALAMVQVSVPHEGKGFGPSERLKVMLRGVKPGASVNLNDMDASTPGSEISVPDTGNDTTTIIMYRVEQSTDDNYETSYTYRALVPAQTIAQGGSLFGVEHEGWLSLSDAALALDFSMTAGQAEKFERTLPVKLIHTVPIPAGTFLMGSSDGTNMNNVDGSGLNTVESEPNRDEGKETQHWVRLTKDFKMSKYPITNAQYVAFLNDMDIDATGKADVGSYGIQTLLQADIITHDGTKWTVPDADKDRPIGYVSWYGAYAFAEWAGGSLPTEAQWEYACRGGEENKPFGIGDGTKLTYDMASFRGTHPYDLAKGGDYVDTSGSIYDKSTVVGTYPYSNGYGLYDMHGNVREWCLDDFADYPGGTTENDPVVDPVQSGTNRVLRGGCWALFGYQCRSAYRGDTFAPSAKFASGGFRIVVPTP